QQEKDAFELAQKQAKEDAKKANHAFYNKPAAGKGSKKRPNAKYRDDIDPALERGLTDDSGLEVTRALKLPPSFAQSYVGQVLNLTTPILGNIKYDRTQVNNFKITP